MEQDNFYYVILKSSYDSLTKENSRLPIISKFRKTNNSFLFKLNKEDGEGPFNSLYELKRKSVIWAGVKKEKDKQKILKSKNIEEITGFIITDETFGIEKNYFDSFSHITIGKVSNKHVSGVHFYHPDKVRIKGIVNRDIKTGVYSAKIELFNKNTSKWIEKKEITTFFPNDWTVSKLFLECYYAFKNKIQVSEKEYVSKTRNGIDVKFFIDEKDRILTFYPIL